MQCPSGTRCRSKRTAKLLTTHSRGIFGRTRQRFCFWTGRTYTDTCVPSLFTSYASYELPRSGLQTQSNTNPVYRGPFDAVKKIASKYGIRGIYKGQGVTFLREAMGYGAYFWAYEKLVQRETARKNIRRDQISLGSAILYGAAAGYAVRDIF
jgi:Mitochondrial carrier protein